MVCRAAAAVAGKVQPRYDRATIPGLPEVRPEARDYNHSANATKSIVIELSSKHRPFGYRSLTQTGVSIFRMLVCFRQRESICP
jgi:hypothetical protein